MGAVGVRVGKGETAFLVRCGELLAVAGDHRVHKRNGGVREGGVIDLRAG